MKTHFILVASLVLSSCIVTPRMETHYDSDCAIAHKTMVLTTQQVNLLEGQVCGGGDCGGLLVGMLLIPPASAVVSGSIALVGNTVFWVEHTARCIQAQRQVTSVEHAIETALPPEI